MRNGRGKMKVLTGEFPYGWTKKKTTSITASNPQRREKRRRRTTRLRLSTESRANGRRSRATWRRGRARRRP